MSGFGLGAFLLAVWLLLWGSVSAANVLSGVAVVALTLYLVPTARFPAGRPRVRVVPALSFLTWVVVDLVRANAVVAREILSRGSSINTGVVAVDLPHCSPGLLTIVANTMSLVPGTMAIEVTQDPGIIHVHVLHLDDVEDVRAYVQRLSSLAVRAFGSDEAIAHLDALEHPHEEAAP